MSATIGTLALAGLLGTPALGALLLAAIPAYRVAAALNVTLCALTLASAGTAVLAPTAALALSARR